MVSRLTVPQHLKKKKVTEKSQNPSHLHGLQKAKSQISHWYLFSLYNIRFFKSYSLVFTAKSVMYCICSKFPYFCLSL